MMQIVFLLIIFSFLCCIINNEEVLAFDSMNTSIVPRIIGGGPTTVTSFRYMASIRNNNRFICVATIIGYYDFLAPAQCFTHKENVIWPYSEVFIHAFTTSTQASGRKYVMQEVSVHPGWTGTGNKVHNIAHIKVEPRIRFNRQQWKVELPSEGVRSNLLGWVTGWGITLPNTEAVLDQMQKATMWTLRYDECQPFMPNQDIQLQEELLCAYQVEGFGCSKIDLGAPLVRHNELIGLFTYNSGEMCAVAEPEVYVNVYSELHFFYPRLLEHNPLDY